MNETDHETIIEARTGWFDFGFDEIWRYRDLLLLFVQKEFISRYRQTFLGPLWFIFQPLLLTGVFSAIFGRIGAIPTDGLPPALFYLCGLVTWGYFVQSFEAITHALLGNTALFRKVYFPRLLIPLSVVVSKLLVFATQFGVFIASLAYYKFFTADAGNFSPNYLWLALTPALLLIAALVSLGAGLWFAALTVKYRDFHHITGFFVQLWFFATPIVYPASHIPEHLMFIYRLNPMALVVDGYRMAFLGQGILNMAEFAWAATLSTLIFTSGLVVFNQVEKNFVDVA